MLSPPRTTPTKKAKAIDKKPILREVKQLIIMATIKAAMEANARRLLDTVHRSLQVLQTQNQNTDSKGIINLLGASHSYTSF